MTAETTLQNDRILGFHLNATSRLIGEDRARAVGRRLRHEDPELFEELHTLADAMDRVLDDRHQVERDFAYLEQAINKARDRMRFGVHVRLACHDVSRILHDSNRAFDDCQDSEDDLDELLEEHLSKPVADEIRSLIYLRPERPVFPGRRRY